MSKTTSGSFFPGDEELQGIPWVQELKVKKGIVLSDKELREMEKAKHQHLDEWLQGKG